MYNKVLVVIFCIRHCAGNHYAYIFMSFTNPSHESFLGVGTP